MWIVACHWELHVGFAVSVDNIVPLNCFHVAQLVVAKLYTSFKDFCKRKPICEFDGNTQFI